MKRFIPFTCQAILFFLIFMPACSRRPDPREIVKKLIAAVDVSDTTGIKECLDLDGILNKRIEGFSEEAKKELLPKIRQEYLEDFVGNGALRMSWKNSLLVIGKSEVKGDSATVEVTYISRQSGSKNYTKMGLDFKDGKWKIYTLRADEM